MRYLLLSLLIASPVYADSFNLAWDAVTLDAQGAPVVGPVTYKLYVSSSPMKATWPPPAAVVPLPTTGTAKTVDQTAIGKYYAVVTASNSIGESGPSNEISFEVKAKPPAVPQGLKVTN